MVPDEAVKRVKSMGLLCLVLGPLMGVTAIGTAAGLFVIRTVSGRLEDMGGSAPVWARWGGIEGFFDFGVHSAPVMLILGIGLTVAGGLAQRSPKKGRVWLVGTAWLCIVGLIALGVIWWVDLKRAGPMIAISGFLVHVLQAGLVVGAVRLLGRPEVKAACEVAT